MKAHSISILSAVLFTVFTTSLCPAQPKPRIIIPLVRVTPQQSAAQLLKRRDSQRKPINNRVGLTPPPPGISSDEINVLLSANGIRSDRRKITPEGVPDNFRLSPRQPYLSSSAYLWLSGEVEFNAQSDSVVLNVETPPGIYVPAVKLPGLGWVDAGPQPDPPAILGTLLRLERGQYLVDFSVSCDVSATYNVTVTGASGAGYFPKDAGGNHVLVVMEATADGYVRVQFSADHSFTFHHVLVRKLG
jgi:hypothetical protein